MSKAIKRQKFTPPQVAAMWGVAPDKIIAFIRSGELRAIDASTGSGQRPRYLIDIDDLRAFERRRAVHTQPQQQRKPRQSPPEAVEYY